ncbi:Stk1 family PASTA domain-containing Ser/Thr kinase [Alloscardovia omnicolens]|uniref:Stk1 family PASTA domain-containing Ser/Thr kinase n=1 Tax=Alloscardovia omnicolens TaxID=419015 RepID=UPI003A768F65
MSIFTPSTLSHGRYTVGDLIGHGGMAEVRKGIDTRLGRTVAIKIMRSDLANDQTFLKRFRLEARSIALLNNPNIVSIFDTDEEEITDPDTGRTVRVPYIVMEYVKGQTLRDILKVNGSLNQRDASQIMLGMLNALEYSHRMGIIHRDIKPGNIMISEQGAVKVMDFGIARMLDDSATTLTQNQGVVGTAQYLSPEQARGEVVDTRSDLYSAGCVLYEMLTGRPPFTGDSAVAIAYQHVSEVATQPTDVIPALDSIWNAVCAKAMAKDRTQRYGTAAQFRKDIATIAAGGTPVIEGATNTVAPLTPTQSDVNATQALPRTQALPVNATADLNSHEMANLAQSTATATPSRAQQRQAALAQKQKKRKKLIAIWATIVVLALVLTGLGGWWYISTSNQQGVVPTITSSMTQAQAQEAIEKAGFVFQAETDNDSTADAGTFTKQSPEGGQTLAKGSIVKVWFSAGPQSVAVPDVTSMTQDEARSTLEKAGFKVGSTSGEDSDSIDKDRITRTDPAAGTNATKGSTITLYVASGNTSVPTGLTGQAQDAATKILTDHHFSVVVKDGDYSDTVPAGSVSSVEPGEGTSVPRNSSVTLVISKGAKPEEKVNLDPAKYVGQTYQNATWALGVLGLNTAAQAGESPTDSAKVTHIYVNGAEVTAATEVAKNATVTLSTK